MKDKYVDIQVLEILVKAINEDLLDADSNSCKLCTSSQILNLNQTLLSLLLPQKDINIKLLIDILQHPD